MTLEELRNQIDVLDRQLVELLNERARAAQMVTQYRWLNEPAGFLRWRRKSP